jgi:hypothetical protein
MEASGMNKAGRAFARLFRIFFVARMPRDIPLLVVTMLLLLQNPHMSYGGVTCWMGVSSPQEYARHSDLVIVGKLARVDRDLVDFRGKRYSKHIGFISVEKVLLKPEDETIPDTIRVYWGSEVSFAHGQNLELQTCRFLRGAWLIERIDGSDDFFLIGPQWAFFVPESALDTFLQSLSAVTPLQTVVRETEASHVLRVRHLNLGDTPSKALSWQSKGARLLVPSPFEVVLTGEDPENPENRHIKAQSEPLSLNNSERITINPHSFVEEEIDITEWISASGGIQQADLLWLKTRGEWDHVVRVVHPLDDLLKNNRIDSWMPLLHGDWGNSVWWFPSTAKARWSLAILCPLLIVAILMFKRQGRLFLGNLSLGLLVGITWTWLFLAYAWKTALALSLAIEGRLSPKYSITMFSVAAILFVFSLWSVRKFGQREAQKSLLIQPVWLTSFLGICIPASAVVTVLFEIEFFGH